MDKKQYVEKGELKECFEAGVINSFDTFNIEAIRDCIDECESVDAVEVVRCKDCIHCIMNYDPKAMVSTQKCGYRGYNPVQSSCVSDNDYCSHGEKAENTGICEKTPDSEFNRQKKRIAFQEEKLNALKAENDCLKKELTDINEKQNYQIGQNEAFIDEIAKLGIENSKLQGMVEAFKFSISKGACNNE